MCVLVTGNAKLYDDSVATVEQTYIKGKLQVEQAEQSNGNGATATTATMDLIVNCCHESLAWIPEWTRVLPRVRNVFIYNKCGQSHFDTLGPRRNVVMDQLFPNASAVGVVSVEELVTNPENDNDGGWNVLGRVYVLSMPNVGREGHSWLTHFLHSWEHQLLRSDWSLLVQGGHEVSLSDVLRGLEDATTRSCDFLDLFQYRFASKWAQRRGVVKDYWGYHIPPNVTEYAWLYDHVCELHDQFTAVNQDNNNNNNKTPCHEAIVALRGEFIIHKSLIAQNRDNPKLHELLKLLSMSNDPQEGHFLERAWIQVLGTDRYCDLLPLKRRYPPHRRRGKTLRSN